MNIKDIITESKHACPNCGGPVVEYSELTEKKDACYYKVKASAKVWPSAYASGRLVQCRKKGAANYGNKSEGVSEAQLDEKCWDGYQQQGMKKKGSRQVPNCVPKESVGEAANAAQQAAIAIAKKKKKDVAEGHDSEELANEVYAEFERTYPNLARRADERTVHAAIMDVLNYGGDSNPSALAQDVARAVKRHQPADSTTSKERQDRALEKTKQALSKPENMAVLKRLKIREQGMAEGLHEQFDIIEEMVESLAEEHGVDADVIWEDFESVDDSELLETAAWRRKEGKSKKGGLNAKGVASYRRENPGSKLQTAVTAKPSKLKPGSKAAKRRKSFCARMGGVKGPMKKPNGKPTRKALALRKWNC